MSKKIIIDHQRCVGCGTCEALCSKFFEMGEDRKSHLKGPGKKVSGFFEEMEVDDIGCAREAVESCPTQAIHVE